MIHLNFSKHIDVNAIPCQEKWQIDLVDFLKDWYSASPTIITKTSGSTGTPKNIELTKKAMAESAKMTGTFLNLKANDSALLCMPSSYIAGKMMLVRAIVWKLDLYCIKPVSHPLENVNREFTFSAMTPMQVENSLDKLYLIKKLIVGGAQPSAQLVSELKKQTTDIYESFGMTETISHIALKKISGHAVNSAFKVMPNTKIRVDERGCLCILPPFLDEEIVTNDLVSLISENEFEWKGRMDHVINSGGIKIFPEQVEKQLKSIIQSDFIISSVQDPVLGNKVVIIIAGKKDINLEKQILDFNFENKYEKPKEFIYVESFAKTPTGKIIRKI